MATSEVPDQEKVYRVEKLLRVVNKRVRRRSRAILGEFGITPPQFEALLLMRDSNELTVGDLSARMYLAYSTTTDLVDRMERHGLLERIRDERDRRVVRLRMLQKGHDMLRAVMSARRQYLLDVLSTMPDESTDQLLAALEMLYEHMDDESCRPQ